MSVLLLMLAVGGCVFAAALLVSRSRRSWLRSRLSVHVLPRGSVPRRSPKERLALAASLFRATERAFSHHHRWRRLERLLERGDVPLRTVELVYLMLGSGFLFAALAAIWGQSAPVILLTLLAGASCPYAVVAVRARGRLRAFEQQLPDLLTTMAASLKAGHSFRQGMQSVVDEGQEPACKEFKRVLNETRLGRPMDGALTEMAERIGSGDLAFAVTAVTIQRQVGGSLAGLFDMVADTVRSRQQFARKVRGLTAMGRASSYVLIALPVFLALALTVLNPEYMAPLYHTGTGQKLIIGGFVMMGLGSLILKKIVSFRA